MILKALKLHARARVIRYSRLFNYKYVGIKDNIFS